MNLKQFIEGLINKRYEHLEKFAAAYLKMTKINPCDAVLVEDRSEMNKIKWYFIKKDSYGKPNVSGS